ncbi:MAG: EAL domain-containing protein [Pseudomonadota bacterium]
MTAACALQFQAIGLGADLTNETVVLLQGLFTAAGVSFLLFAFTTPKRSALFRTITFAAAIGVAGMGVLNLLAVVDIGQLMRWSMIASGGFAVILTVLHALRGDPGAQMVLPGVVLVTAGLALTGIIPPLQSNALFVLGVIAASLVVLVDRRAAIAGPVGHAPVHNSARVTAPQSRFQQWNERENEEIVLDSQLAKVLDYSGVAVWDWSEASSDQTASLHSILGADSAGAFTPEALRQFIHKDDLAKFEQQIIDPTDGPFDTILKIHDGGHVRLRGARAVYPDSEDLERIVAFIEKAPQQTSGPSRTTGVAPAPIELRSGEVSRDLVADGAKLSKALEDGDIVAAFQPIVSIKNKSVVGYEALARWRGKPDGEAPGPETFVRTADAVGKGAKLAKAMLTEAVAFLTKQQADKSDGELFVALNVSYTQMRDPAFRAAVRSAYTRHKLAKGALVLELTEGDALTNEKEASAVFRDLKKTGVTLAFDDFGAGFSCLSNLHKYEFDYIKIDKSFVVDLEKDTHKSKIVSALAGLGRDLGMKVIAEGVETQGLASAVQRLGCDFAQGYAFGPAGKSEIKEAPIFDKSASTNKITSPTNKNARFDDGDEKAGRRTNIVKDKKRPNWRRDLR